MCYVIIGAEHMVRRMQSYRALVATLAALVLGRNATVLGETLPCCDTSLQQANARRYHTAIPYVGVGDQGPLNATGGATAVQFVSWRTLASTA